MAWTALAAPEKRLSASQPRDLLALLVFAASRRRIASAWPIRPSASARAVRLWSREGKLVGRILLHRHQFDEVIHAQSATHARLPPSGQRVVRTRCRWPWAVPSRPHKEEPHSSPTAIASQSTVAPTGARRGKFQRASMFRATTNATPLRSPIHAPRDSRGCVPLFQQYHGASGLAS